MDFPRIIPLLLAMPFTFSSQASTFSQVTLSPLDGNHYRLRIGLSGAEQPDYSLAYIPNPDRLIVDLHAVDYPPSFSTRFDGLTATRVRGARQPNGNYRLVVDGTKPMLFVCSALVAGAEGQELQLTFRPQLATDNNRAYRSFSALPDCDPALNAASAAGLAAEHGGQVPERKEPESKAPESKAPESKAPEALAGWVHHQVGGQWQPAELQQLNQSSATNNIHEIAVHDDATGNLQGYIRITGTEPTAALRLAQLAQPHRLVLDLANTHFHPLYRQRFTSDAFLHLHGEQLPLNHYRLAFESKAPISAQCTSQLAHGDKSVLIVGVGNRSATQPLPGDTSMGSLPDCNLSPSALADIVPTPVAATLLSVASQSVPDMPAHADLAEEPTSGPLPDQAPLTNGQTTFSNGLDDGLEFDLKAILGNSGLSERQIESLLDHGVSDGDYLLDLSINGRSIGRDWVRVYGGKLCFSSTTLLSRYVQEHAFSQLNGCFELPESQTAQQLDVHRQRLNLVLSENYLINNSNGFQRGGTGLALNYNLNYRHSSFDNRSTVSGQTELRGFANNWILQSRQSYFGNQLFFNDSFVQRDFTSYGMRFQAGRIATSGFALDGYRYDGIRLQSNNQQIQGAMQGRIEGSTLGPATVTISQNGSQLYQSMVPGGDYVLSNFQLRNTSSPLTVTELQDDGTEYSYEVAARLALPARFYQPASGVPSYYLSLGVTEVTNSAFVMGGLQLDSQYSRWQQAFDLALFDEQIANAGFRLSHHRSDALHWDLSYRMSYASASDVPSTGQQMYLHGGWSVPRYSVSAGVQYNSRYFINPLQRIQPEQLTLSALQPQGVQPVPYREQAVRYNLNVSASYSIPDLLRSRLNLGWFWQESYDNANSQSMLASWSGHYRTASFSAGYSKQLNSSDNYLFYADLRIPFGQRSNRAQFVQRYNESASRQSYNAQLTSRINDLSYSLGYSQDLRASRHGYSASVNTPTSLANLSASYSRQGNNDTVFVSGSGSVVATPKALAIGPERAGDTLVLVSTRDIDSENLVRGVPLQGQRRAPLLSHSLDAGSSAYRSRHISLNQSALQPSQQVVYGRTEVRPMAGTVLHEEFLIRQVSRYLLNVSVNGEPVAALSHLFRENGDLIGVTDHRGQIFISDNRIRQHVYYLELPDGTECRMNIDWSSIRDSGNDYFQTGDAQCEL